MKAKPINGMRWYLRFAIDGHSKDVRLYFQHLVKLFGDVEPFGQWP